MNDRFQEELERSRQGSREALDQLLARWQPLLWLQARRLLGNQLSARVDPADVVQETLTQAFRELSTFRGTSEAEWVAWLRQLTAGHAAKAWRTHGADKRAVSREVALAETLSLDGQPSGLARLITQEDVSRLAAAIQDLPDAMREVLVRRVFHQEPFEAIAAALQRSPGSTRVLWTRAIRQLRARLQSGIKPGQSSGLSR